MMTWFARKRGALLVFLTFYSWQKHRFWRNSIVISWFETSTIKQRSLAGGDDLPFQKWFPPLCFPPLCFPPFLRMQKSPVIHVFLRAKNLARNFKNFVILDSEKRPKKYPKDPKERLRLSTFVIWVPFLSPLENFSGRLVISRMTKFLIFRAKIPAAAGEIGRSRAEIQ